MSDLRYCPARMYEHACELRYDHDGDHCRGGFAWERLAPGKAPPDAAGSADKARRCRIVADDKPQVWNDGEWVCTQTTLCLTCQDVSVSRLSGDDATWADAMAAAVTALPYPPEVLTREDGS